MTFAEKMSVASNRPAGFDYMRFVLATAVIVHHSFTATETIQRTSAKWFTPDRAAFGLILPMFFALSGYLVAGSLERNKSLVSFLGLRVIRLVPALALEVFLSALILGPLLTSLPLQAYFNSPIFRSYFLNIAGDIHYYLPGVFEHNIHKGIVNTQLWTIPFELKCYVALAVLGLVGIAARRNLLGWLLAAFQVAIIPAIIALHLPASGKFPGSVLVGCFLAGLAIYKFRDRITSSAPLGGISLGLTSALMLVPYGYYFVSLPAAYATVWIGTFNPPRSKFLLSGDYSYGLYLYGFPLQQAFSSLGSWTYVWWLDLVCVYPVALAFAVFSWWTVEKPATRLRIFVMACERWAMRFHPIAWHSEKLFVAKYTSQKTDTQGAAI